jgi:DNA-binding transcriptional ArsR family regulator
MGEAFEDHLLASHIMDGTIHYMRTAPPLLAPLFRSEGQARLLAELFLSQGEYPSLTALAERAGVAYATAHREIGRLLEAGIVAEQQVGNVRVIRPNENSPLANPLRQLLAVSAGPVAFLTAELENIHGIRSAFVFGSFAARVLGVPGDPPADVDVMVIGEPNPVEVYDACRRVGDRIHRPVNPTIMSTAEWATGSVFINHVKHNPVIPIVGALPWH